MKKDLTTFLRFTPFFGGISNDIVEKLIALADQKTVLSGQCFFREDDEAQSMFVLLSGVVEVYKTWEGHKHIITHLHQGDCFGEMSIIDYCRRSATVVALEDCDILEIGVDSFAEIYKQDLKQYTLMQMNIGRELSRRLREANALLFRLKMENEFKQKAETPL